MNKIGILTLIVLLSVLRLAHSDTPKDAGVKIIFHQNNFYTFSELNPYTNCAGDLKTYFYPINSLNNQPVAFPSNSTDPNITLKPSFISNVSVDLTDLQIQGASRAAYSCFSPSKSSLPEKSYRCASFQQTSFENFGFYSFFDRDCEHWGQLQSDTNSMSKLTAGGVYIDLNRTVLGAKENMILHLTYVPIPIVQTINDDPAYPTWPILKLHLIQTNDLTSDLQKAFQPRHLFYAFDNKYPKVVESLSLLAPQSQQITQEQILLPLSIHPGIDRIRIERYSGSALLIEASLFRTGAK